MDAAARARRQRGVGLRFAVEVEPHRKHDARAAVAEDDLGRLPRVHRAQHRPRLPGLHLLRGVRLLTTGLFPALPFGAVLLCARPGLRQLPRLPGLYLPEPRQPGLGASGFADGAGRGGAGCACACSGGRARTFARSQGGWRPVAEMAGVSPRACAEGSPSHRGLISLRRCDARRSVTPCPFPLEVCFFLLLVCVVLFILLGSSWFLPHSPYHLRYRFLINQVCLHLGSQN